MRCTWISAFLLFLAGCAAVPARHPSATSGSSSVWFPWPEWTPVPVSLLESTENGEALVAAARARSRPEPVAVATPNPAPSPPKPASAVSPPGEMETELAEAGKSVKFAVSADGTPPLSFQWRKNGQPIAGATTALLTIEKVSPQHEGKYDCIVTNSAGSMTSPPFRLVVQSP